MALYFKSLYTKKQIISLGLGLVIPSVGKTTITEFVSNMDDLPHRAELTHTGKKSPYNESLFSLSFIRI